MILFHPKIINNMNNIVTAAIEEYLLFLKSWSEEASFYFESKIIGKAFNSERKRLFLVEMEDTI